MAAVDRIQVVSFDAFGTLLELDDPIGDLQRGLAAAGHVYAAAAVAAAFRAEVRVYRRNQDLGRDAAGLEDLGRLCAAAFADALPSGSSCRDVAKVLLGDLRYRLFGDVIPALEALASRGVRCAVVSNWDCSLPDVLARLGILDRFATVTVSAVVGARKPDPRIFAHALTALSVSPHQALHVGDDRLRDVDGARSVGMRAVVIDRSRDRVDDDPERIASLRDLPALLE